MTVTYVTPTAPPLATAPTPEPTAPAPALYAKKVKALPVVKVLIYGGVPTTTDFDPLSQLRAYQGGNGERILLVGGLPDEHLPMARAADGMPLPDAPAPVIAEGS